MSYWQMQKILIIGSGGAGKSTLARELARILNLDIIHLDAFYWQPGWVETAKDEWQIITQNLIQRESWIIDGNYSSTWDLRLPVAVQYRLPTAMKLQPETPENAVYKALDTPNKNAIIFRII